MMENGIHAEESYQYSGWDETCMTSEIATDPYETISGYVEVDYYSVEAHMEALQESPLAVALSTCGYLQFYSEGIINIDCYQYYPQPDHAVLMVGYGEDECGTKYWILRNSWGADWGENGYFRVLRGEISDYNPGYLGVLDWSYYPYYA